MKKQTEVLYEAFDIANKEVFNNEIPTPTITIQTKGTAKAYGWCSVQPIWIGDTKTHELNLSAEYANRPFIEIMGTLIHEMVHLHNLSKGIKDCSRGGSYHNKGFRDSSEAVGLEVEKSTKYGWAHTKVGEVLEEQIHGWKLDEKTFNIARIDFDTYVAKKGEDGEDENPKTGAKRKKSSSIKYVCPDCGSIVRATKELNIYCGDCGVQFEAEEQE